MNTQTDYEKNRAVAEKLRYVVKERFKDTGIVILEYLFDGKSVIRPVDYCNDPRDYMPIAIEHGIAIDFNRDKSTVCAVFTKNNADTEIYNPDDYIFSEDLPKDKTGHAVVDAFLAMDITTNES